jgi:putative hydrolase of the HAD superfamily
MPRPEIQAVVFDLGGTLEEVHYDDASRLAAARGLRDLLAARGLDPGLPPEDLQATVLSGMAVYQRWREETLRELPPDRVWGEFVLPACGFPSDRLAEAAEELMFYYEDHFFTRRARPEASAVLDDLRERGLRLAVISNIISRTLVPRKLAEYGIAGHFDPILTSAAFGYRKPHPSIFEEAARQMRLRPAVCAYVGDTVSRDVAGARRAGYGMAIQIRSFLTHKSDGEVTDPAPDVVIGDLWAVRDLVMGAASQRPA